MLAHFPPLPLIIDHIDDKYHVLSPEDEEGIIFALQHRDRTANFRFWNTCQLTIAGLSGLWSKLLRI